MDKKMTLGGFEAVLDSFIPNPDGGFRNSNVDENVNVNADEFESLDDAELFPSRLAASISLSAFIVKYADSMRFLTPPLA